MRRSARSQRIGLLFLLVLAGFARAAFTIQLDFTHDDASSNPFFSGSLEATTRRAALQAAVDDINSLLSANNITAITTDPVVGVNGSTTATLDPRIIYTNPDLQSTTPIEITDLTEFGEGEFRIFVGSRDLSTAGGLGSDNTLAQGGRAGTAISISGSGNRSQWVGAMAAAEAAFNAQFERNGPIMDNYTGSVLLGGTSASYDLNIGITAGHLWFDSDTNNDQIPDTDAILAGFWHSDHTVDVASAEFDIYTVGLHEILHTIGFANSNVAFSSNVTGGNDWTGSRVVAILGGGDNNALEPTSTSHLNLNTSSFVFGTDIVQDPVMEPTLSSGTRRFITNLDAAILADMGFLVPEVSGTLVLLPLLGSTACWHRRRIRPAVVS